MSLTNRTNSREDHLNDSWVELNFRSSQRSSMAQSPAVTPPLLATAGGTPPLLVGAGGMVNTLQMEKLLLEAQRESRGSSLASNNSSRGSPKSPHSPTNETSDATHSTPVSGPMVADRTQDWIWEWSSRPEVQPQSGNGNRYKHPQRAPLSVRNTRVMRSGGVFSIDNLPTLIFSHACTFVIGAAVMFLYLKKFCKLPAITTLSQQID